MKKKFNIQKMRIKVTSRRITLFFIVLMVMILFFSGFTLGKDISKIKLKTNLEIAKPILVVDTEKELQINSIDSLNNSYKFKVKNYNKDDEINEIQLLYNIEIISKYNEIFTMKLFKGTEEIELVNNKTKNLLLKTRNKQEDNYELKIICNKNKTNSIEELLDNIQIKIHSEQVKL